MPSIIVKYIDSNIKLLVYDNDMFKKNGSERGRNPRMDFSRKRG